MNKNCNQYYHIIKTQILPQSPMLLQDNQDLHNKRSSNCSSDSPQSPILSLNRSTIHYHYQHKLDNRDSPQSPILSKLSQRTNNNNQDLI
jgi:hypothetical protein